MSRRQRLAKWTRKLDAIYARLPAIDCQGLCAEACGPIAMSRPELIRIEDLLGHRVPIYNAERGYCPLLTADQRCSVYPVRPFVCRLWGLVEKMRCPHGCVPARWVSDVEATLLQLEVDAIDPSHGRAWIMPAHWLEAMAVSVGYRTPEDIAGYVRQMRQGPASTPEESEELRVRVLRFLVGRNLSEE